jgi:hypothetical protein
MVVVLIGAEFKGSLPIDLAQAPIDLASRAPGRMEAARWHYSRFPLIDQGDFDHTSPTRLVDLRIAESRGRRRAQGCQ